ncbi:hypothetical protein HELRODRAFT_96888 [Helobdella robusta]|uniref:Rho-GAP domain-containing protein n=1 Tax=Helobdella robusta TaxID=6412 RepID=T1G9E2_HELRO|nr:hypothetical protein HELRODRAFT_96888 [Helobdella robusta]ESO10549.1 hypothetical protein HELRODRAFT_96888 [Helobdella robusta]
MCENWKFPEDGIYRFDASVPASLLKLWLRQLHEPLIPYDVYPRCSKASEDVNDAICIVSNDSNLLPDDNKLVLAYVIRFLQVFAAPSTVAHTKMDANNLAMVMAPNLLRSKVIDSRTVLDQAKREMSFVRLLILHWDTSFMEDVE